MTWAQLLIALAGPIALRVITALGMGVLTFTGVQTALNGLIEMAQSSWAGMGADVLGLAGVAGIPQCLGIIAGAMSARVGMFVAASATRWILKK